MIGVQYVTNYCSALQTLKTKKSLYYILEQFIKFIMNTYLKTRYVTLSIGWYKKKLFLKIILTPKNIESVMTVPGFPYLPSES